MKELLQVDNIKKSFEIKKRLFKSAIEICVIDGVSFKISKKQIFGLIGESGCGKTTIGRLVTKLIEPSSGKMFFNNKNISEMNKNETKEFRKKIGMIFQDPYESLNPRFTIINSVKEPLDIDGRMTKQEKFDCVKNIFKKIGLDTTEYFLNKYPHELSGGQRQRISIARSLIMKPKLIIADEPCSMLDVSIRSDIMNIILKFKQELEMSAIYITHDLSEAKYITDFVAVMYLGKIVETGQTQDIIDDPYHPYTKMLISAIPDIISKFKINISEKIPDPMNIPHGCAFHPRCPYAKEICKRIEPENVNVGEGHLVKCHLF